MLFGPVLQTVTMLVGIALLSSAQASESRVLMDEFAVSWKGDGQLLVSKDEAGKTVVRCECRGEVRVSNKQFEAQAKHLTYDSAKQTLLLDGDVKLKVHDAAGQPAVGELLAERVILRIADDQVSMETFGAKLIGTVRLQPKGD